MFSILKKEFNSFLNSLIAYIVISVFLVGIGLFMWVFPDSNVLDYGFADMSTLFAMAPYVFLFLIPAITMRSFAEEKKAGTLELLFTQPLSDFQIIIGKYSASLLLVIFTLLPTLLYYYTVYQLGSPKGNIDSAGVFGSYIGLVMLAAVFTAIGIFSSAITENQIVAFIVAIFLCFIIYTGFSSLSTMAIWGQSADLINAFGIEYHYQSLSKGLIDSRDMAYFFSVIAAMIISTQLVLGSRKW
jgi:ABC-2 type transport system permease protein